MIYRGKYQLPGDLKQKFEDCERRGKNTYLGGQDQCFTVDKSGNAYGNTVYWVTYYWPRIPVRKCLEDDNSPNNVLRRERIGPINKACCNFFEFGIHFSISLTRTPRERFKQTLHTRGALFFINCILSNIYLNIYIYKNIYLLIKEIQ